MDSSNPAQDRAKGRRVSGDLGEDFVPGQGGLRGPLGRGEKAYLLGPPDKEKQDPERKRISEELARAQRDGDKAAVLKALDELKRADAAMKKRKEARLRRRTKSGLEAGMRLLNDVSDESDNPNKEFSS